MKDERGDPVTLEGALIAASSQWRATFDAINDAVCLVDLDGTVLRANIRFAELVGRPVTELTGEKCCTLVHGAPKRLPGCPWVPMLDAGERQEGEFLLGGRWFWAAVDPVFDDDGKVIGAVHLFSDISERKRAEAALRDSEERYRLLVSQSPDGIFLADLDGRFLAVNQTMCGELGYTEGELLAMTTRDIVSEDDADPRGARLVGLFQGEAVNDPAEYQVRTRDGRTRTIEVRTAPFWRDGKVVGYHGISRDRTAQRQAESKLHLLAHAVRSISECVSITDLEDRLLFVNPAFERTYGYDEGELVGKSIGVILPDEPHSHELDEVRRATIAGGWHGERVNRRKDGSLVPVSVSTSVVRNEAGQPIALIGVASDISERERMEFALRESQASLERIINCIADPVFVKDDQHRFVLVNDAQCAMAGRSREELLGKTDLECYPREEVDIFWEQDALVLETGQESVSEESVTSSQGESHIVLTKKSLLIDDAGRRFVVGVVRDISDRKRLEEQLLQSQKMQAVGSLAGGVAHDFNNLLQAMLSHVQLLPSAADDPNRVRAVAQELAQQISLGASLTRQLLLFSRRETVKPERVDVNAVVQDATLMLRRLVRANIAVRVELDSGPLKVVADRGQLQQVLVNLTVNASDAMPHGGELVVTTGARDGDEVWLALEDTGFGVPQEIRERIFEPFFTTKASGRGTGLGLSVVHGIVAQHGGRVELESTVGQGSVFRVVLPRAASGEYSAVDDDVLPAATPEPGRGERILVVEDEDGARGGLRDLLLALGYDVMAVATAEEALQLKEGIPFEVLLTDLMLPGVLGPELAHVLHEAWPDLKVIMMSGYTEDEIVRRGVFAGVVRFLQKPFDMTTLAAEVRSALDEDI